MRKENYHHKLQCINFSGVQGGQCKKGGSQYRKEELAKE